MLEPTRAPSPPVGQVIRLTDFHEASLFFNQWQGRFEQISRGRFEGTLRFVRGGLVRVVGIESNQHVLVRGHDSAGLFSIYPVTDGNAGSVWQGRRLTSGHLVALGTDTETDHYAARQAKNSGVSLRPQVLADAARLLLGTDGIAPPHSWAVVSPLPGALARLNSQLSNLLTLGVAVPSLLQTAEGHRLEQECVRSVVAALFPDVVPLPAPSLPARSQLLRRAEEYMRSRLGDPVGAIDLCRELGVSDRTLRLAFRERYGLGPMAYYKCLRLNAVRSRLRAAPFATVTAAAREFGFHHLGNFTADYRRLFGEPPQRRTRAADSPGMSAGEPPT